MYGRKVYNYRDNYSIHPYNTHNTHYIPSNEQEVRGYNCTLGRVMRLVLYGNPRLIDKHNVTYGIANPSGEMVSVRGGQVSRN